MKQTANTWNFDGFDYHGSAWLSYCPVVSANREGTGDMHVTWTCLIASLDNVCQAYSVLLYFWLRKTLLSHKTLVHNYQVT